MPIVVSKQKGRPDDRADALLNKLTHARVRVYRIGCPPVRPSAFIAMFIGLNRIQQLSFSRPFRDHYGRLYCVLI